jgi:hypothetical protein
VVALVEVSAAVSLAHCALATPVLVTAATTA